MTAKIVAIFYKGVTPIEKNVIVVDEQGNEYEATYPKRAKGLVKNGRARFVAENKICLACPPNENLEENEMSETSENTAIAENVQNDQKKEITLQYILKQIEKIMEDTKHIYDALKMLEGVKSDGPGDIGAQEKAKGIATVVKCRETTNQQLLGFYRKLYDDINGTAFEEMTQKVNIAKASFDHVLSHLSDMKLEPQDRFAAVGEVTEQISQLVSQVLNK